MKMPILAVTVLALTLAACGTAPGATPNPTGTPGATPAPTPTPLPSPSAGAWGPDDVVIKIENVGGMMPPWMTVQNYPSVALYGDGRLITLGPQIAIYPGPALPNLQVTRISQRGIEQLIAWAADAGLIGPDRQLGRPILDAGVWVVTVNRPEGRHVTTVTDFGEADAAIAAVARFQELLLNVRQWLPDEIVGADSAYDWQRLRVVSFVADEGAIVDPALATEVDWPLGDLATLGQPLAEPTSYRCFSVEGDDLAALRPMLEQANQLTLWRSNDVPYQLYLHPMLPDEEGCPGF